MHYSIQLKKLALLEVCTRLSCTTALLLCQVRGLFSIDQCARVGQLPLLAKMGEFGELSMQAVCKMGDVLLGD